jgi:hypothetical protein
MKAAFWIGVVLLILGLASFVVPIPQTERNSVSAGGITLGVKTQHQQTVSPVISAVLLLGGAGLIIAGRVKRG